MHPHPPTHDHVFDVGSTAAERSTRIVLWITLITMVAEIAAGWRYNSMALLADGWHMSSHAMAIGLTAMAYATARRYSRDPRFAFGTWKIEVLAGFAGALLLVVVAAFMVAGSVERLISPQPIRYREGLLVATLGLAVNVVCAVILGRAHHEPSAPGSRGHAHDHAHSHSDLNLRSAYLHVLADAATSVLAIAALAGGLIYGWSWLDPLTGLVGALLIVLWARGLLVDTGKVLLDREMDDPVVEEIRQAVEAGAPGEQTSVTDLHVWRVGKRVYSCALTVVTHDPAITADTIRMRLAVHEEIAHSTIEIHLCTAGDGAATEAARTR